MILIVCERPEQSAALNLLRRRLHSPTHGGFSLFFLHTIHPGCLLVQINHATVFNIFADYSGKSVQDPGCCTEGILNVSQHHSYSNMPFIRSSDWFEAQQVWGNTAAVSPHVVYGETRPNRNSYAIRFALNEFIKEAEKERGGKKAQLGERDLGNLQRVHAPHTESFQPTSVRLVIYFKWQQTTSKVWTPNVNRQTKQTDIW